MSFFSNLKQRMIARGKQRKLNTVARLLQEIHGDERIGSLTISNGVEKVTVDICVSLAKRKTWAKRVLLSSFNKTAQEQYRKATVRHMKENRAKDDTK